MKKHNLAVILVLILSTISLTCNAFACRANYISLEDRFATADHAVIVTVKGIKTAYRDGQGYSIVELKVEEYLKTPLRCTSISFWSLGFPHNISGVQYSIQAYFDINEKVCVLLKTNNSRLYLQDDALGKIKLEEVDNMLIPTENIVASTILIDEFNACIATKEVPNVFIAGLILLRAHENRKLS